MQQRSQSLHIEMFCCYAREDLDLFHHLEQHLAALKREGLATLWADVYMVAGTAWEEAIHRHLETAQIVLLLISPAFLNSDACFHEMERALAREQRGEAKVIPILLRPVNWKQTPFSRLQMLPQEAKPVESSSWSNRDEALEKVTEGIRQVITALLAEQEVAEPFLSVPVLAPVQEKVTPSSTALSGDAGIEASHSSPGPAQIVLPSPSSQTIPPPLAPAHLKRRRSPMLVGVLLLLILGLVAGGSIDIWGAVRTAQARSATATVQAHKATITAQGSGRTWHIQFSGTSNGLFGVAGSGSRFVAVGSHGTILASQDGSTWTPEDSGTSNALFGVAWSGSRFVAVGDETLTSQDGSTWTPGDSSASNTFNGVAGSGSQFVAVGAAGKIRTSQDGSTWTPENSGASNNLYGIAWSGSEFVAVGDETLILAS